VSRTPYVLVALITLLAAAAWAAQNEGTAAPIQGRFVIAFSPIVRADTFLVDTETGRVWQSIRYTDMPGEPLIWRYMERVDSHEHLLKWFDRYAKDRPGG